MESPLLTQSDHNADSSPNEEHIYIVRMVSDDVADQELLEESWRLCDPIYEFIVTLVLIIAATLVLTLTKDGKKAEVSLYPWIIGYLCGSIVILPILCWRFWQYWQYVNAKTRINKVIGKLKKLLEIFFVGWVLVLLWHLFENLSSLDDTTPHIWLCVAFLACSFILHVLPNVKCAALCLLPPLVVRLIPALSYVVVFLKDIWTNLASHTWEIIAIVAVVVCLCGILACLCRDD